MEEIIYDVNLSGMNEIFNNKTFRYRINGFAHACGMKNIGVLGNSGVLFSAKGYNKYVNDTNELGYFIAINEDDYVSCKKVGISGHYEDLNFVFTNYYQKEKLDKKIVDLPFYIFLTKKINDDTYDLVIKTDDGKRTQFKISKYRDLKDRTIYDHVIFYANVTDFSTILKLVKSFVFNPILVFNTYNEIQHKYKAVYTNNDLDKGIMQDEKLDKPVKGIKKLVKKIIN